MSRRVLSGAPLARRVALAGLGALIVHQFAYLIAFTLQNAPAAAEDHAHLGLLWAMASPLAIVAAIGGLLGVVRTSGVARPNDASHLGPWVAAGYLIQELGETVLAGHSVLGLLAQPSLTIGLMLAPLVGWVIHRFLAQAATLVAAMLQPADAPRLPGTAFAYELFAVLAIAPAGPVRACVTMRGPPVRFVAI